MPRRRFGVQSAWFRLVNCLRSGAEIVRVSLFCRSYFTLREAFASEDNLRSLKSINSDSNALTGPPLGTLGTGQGIFFLKLGWPRQD